MTFSDPSPSPVPQHLSAVAREFQSINRVSAWAPFTWMRKGFADLFIAQFNSLFYGVAFALIGWTIAFFYGASYGLTLTASSAFMLIAPVLALGLYALSHQIEQGETPRLRTTLTVWRGNMANIALYALVTGVVGLIWARAAVVIFAVFYNTGLPSAGEFVTAIMRLDNIEFVVAYFGVGALFATFVSAGDTSTALRQSLMCTVLVVVCMVLNGLVRRHAAAIWNPEGDMGDIEIWEIVRLAEWRSLEAGTVVMQEGEPGNYFCVLVEGELRVLKQDHLLDTLSAGDCFGEMALFAAGRGARTSSVETLTPARILTIRAPALLRASAVCQMHFYKGFLEVLATRLSVANSRIASV